MIVLNMKNSLRVLARGPVVLAALAASAALAQPVDQIDVNADAAPRVVTTTQAVTTRDLDLTSRQGRGVLDHRIKIAAAKVCDVWDGGSQRPVGDYSRCYEGALQGGRAQAAARSASRDGVAVRVSAS